MRMVARVTSAPESLCCSQHQPVVHLVDVVAGEDQHVLGLLGADGVDVLVDGVGGAQVPVLAHPLHGRQDLDELAQVAGHDVPALADVAVQRQRLVLGEDVDVAQVGVDAVGERDVDDAVDAAEGDRRLGAVAGQGIQALPRASRQQDSQRVFHRLSVDERQPCAASKKMVADNETGYRVHRSTGVDEVAKQRSVDRR